MRTILQSSVLLTFFAAARGDVGSKLASLEDEAVTLLGAYVSQDYNDLVSELAGIIASAVPSGAVISDLPALVTAVQPQLTAAESELAAYFEGVLASAEAPSAIQNAAPAVATDLIEDVVEILEDIITSEFSATMAITKVPEVLATAKPEVLSEIPKLGEALFGELASDIQPISKQLMSWLPGAISTWEGLVGANATGTLATATSGASAAPSSSGPAVQQNEASGRGIAGGLLGIATLLTVVACL
jgi:hypothetical protein